MKGKHTLHGGVDLRRAQRDRTGGGNRSGQMTFDRTYTRQFSDESSLTPSNLGLALAAFELGLPTSASINDELPSTFSNYWTAAFGQDNLATRAIDELTQALEALTGAGARAEAVPA